MKISFILPSIGDSGGIKVVNKYAELLANRGHDIVIYKSIIAFNMHRYKYKIQNIIHQIYCSIKGLRAACIPGKFDKFVLKINDSTIRDGECIIATSWPTSYLVNNLADSKGAKCYFVQGYEIWDNRLLGEESYKLLLHKIVIANWIKEKITILGEDTKTIPVIYNGIEYKLFNQKRSYHKKEEMHFLMLDHSLSEKGVKYGILAFEKLQQKYPKVKLAMFGMKRSNNVPAYAEYHENPSQDELVKLYNSSDVFLFPSLEEGWGLTVIEAMASGCAVVGTNTGCLLEIGENKGNCMKSKPTDVDTMVENAEMIMKDKVLFETIVRNGKNSAKKLDWDKAVVQFEREIHRVCNTNIK